MLQEVEEIRKEVDNLLSHFKKLMPNAKVLEVGAANDERAYWDGENENHVSRLIQEDWDITEKTSFASRFDIVICTEVLEHVDITKLHRVPENLAAITGKVLLITTPFAFRIHGPLPDNVRLTEHGLISLFSPYFDVFVRRSGPALSPYHYQLICIKK